MYDQTFADLMEELETEKQESEMRIQAIKAKIREHLKNQ